MNELGQFKFSVEMRSFVVICCILFALAVADVIHESIENDDNPGEALYLTEYIERGDIETARNLAFVTLPNVSIPSYAGYFTVNKTYNSNLFFWFFPALENPDNAPVLLWLQGGPGASSVKSFFIEIGLFMYTGVEQKLVPRDYSWHLNHSMIYIDSPPGGGFSFTDSDAGYAKNEVDVGQNLLKALHQFFLLFPHLQNNEFYVTGQSYGGKFVPALGHAIHEDSKRNNSDPMKPKINMKGLAIGNGNTDPINQAKIADYMYQLGLIDFNAHAEMTKQEDDAIECMKNRDFSCASSIFRKIHKSFDTLTGFDNLLNFLHTDRVDTSTPFRKFVGRNDIRRAIHVGNNTLDLSKRKVKKHLELDRFDSVADWMAELLSHYRILVWTGQLDLVVPYTATEKFLRNLNFSAVEKYKTAKRIIWHVDNEIAGYAKQAGNLTEVLVRNAGHNAPRDQPKWCFDMMLRFIHHKGFD